MRPLANCLAGCPDALCCGGNFHVYVQQQQQQQQQHAMHIMQHHQHHQHHVMHMMQQQQQQQQKEHIYPTFEVSRWSSGRMSMM